MYSKRYNICNLLFYYLIFVSHNIGFGRLLMIDLGKHFWFQLAKLEETIREICNINILSMNECSQKFFIFLIGQAYTHAHSRLFLDNTHSHLHLRRWISDQARGQSRATRNFAGVLTMRYGKEKNRLGTRLASLGRLMRKRTAAERRGISESGRFLKEEALQEA